MINRKAVRLVGVVMAGIPRLRVLMPHLFLAAKASASRSCGRKPAGPRHPAPASRETATSRTCWIDAAVSRLAYAEHSRSPSFRWWLRDVAAIAAENSLRQNLCVGLVAIALVLMISPSVYSDTTQERVLLLRTGRVVKGQMRQVSTGWLVQAKHGRLAIPTDQVRLDADSVEEIYLSLRLELLRDPTAGRHLNLADWCLSQKLLGQAAFEIREAVQLDPQNETARLMLKRLQTHIDREAAARQPEPDRDQLAESSARVEVDQTGLAARREVRGLASLKPETANEFVRVVQPILFNGCANARCHGQASENGFRLDRFRYGAGGHRLKSERNLATLLKYIDPNSPGRSRLITAATDAHGGRTAFHGQAANTQIASLTRWIQAASRELFPAGQRRAADSSSSPFASPASASLTPEPLRPEPGPPGRTTGANPPQLLSDSVTSTASPAVRQPDESPAGQSPPTRPGRLRGFNEILRETEAAQARPKNDVFDPDEFNRRFAGVRSR